VEPSPTHTPVLLSETIAALSPLPGQTLVDCTAGLGGHAAALAPRLSPGGSVVLNDSDPGNLERAATRVREAAGPGVRVIALRGNFAELPHRLASAEVGVNADMVLADLGFSSNQIDDGARGFSFMRDGPLDMRLDPALPVSAADLVASLPEAELAALIEEFGEERNARRIARKLAQGRAAGPILTTVRLAELVRSASPGGGHGAVHPATRTFQALRIAVNDELGSLGALLGAVGREARMLAKGEAGTWLALGARVAVITFHSLEDRPVKGAFAELIGRGAADITGGPTTPGEDEVDRNSRSRSAKLRAIRLPG